MASWTRIFDSGSLPAWSEQGCEVKKKPLAFRFQHHGPAAWSETLDLLPGRARQSHYKVGRIGGGRDCNRNFCSINCLVKEEWLPVSRSRPRVGCWRPKPTPPPRPPAAPPNMLSVKEAATVPTKYLRGPIIFLCVLRSPITSWAWNLLQEAGSAAFFCRRDYDQGDTAPCQLVEAFFNPHLHPSVFPNSQGFVVVGSRWRFIHLALPLLPALVELLFRHCDIRVDRPGQPFPDCAPSMLLVEQLAPSFSGSNFHRSPEGFNSKFCQCWKQRVSLCTKRIPSTLVGSEDESAASPMLRLNYPKRAAFP